MAYEKEVRMLLEELTEFRSSETEASHVEEINNDINVGGGGGGGGEMDWGIDAKSGINGLFHYAYAWEWTWVEDSVPQNSLVILSISVFFICMFSGPLAILCRC